MKSDTDCARAGSSVPGGSRPVFVVRILRHAAGLIVLGLVLVTGYRWSLIPPDRGLLRLQNLHEPVLIFRDSNGVPLINSATPRDAFFSMGYVHAQDRLWQMEILRRAAWGELTPLLGRDAVPLDVWFRRVGLYRQSMRLSDALSTRSRRWLQAYVEGINAFLKAHPTRLPPEFLLKRHRPAPWKIEDALCIGALAGWLATPESLRVPAGFSPEEISAGDSIVSLTSIPPGLIYLRGLISVEVDSDARGFSFSLSWGCPIPTPWYEQGVAVRSGAVLRGWTIPGWPVPMVAARGAWAEVLVTGGWDAPLWERIERTSEPRPVLEFVGDDTETILVDTVWVMDEYSLVSLRGPSDTVVGTRGSPGLSAAWIHDRLNSWVEYSDSGPSSSQYREPGPFQERIFLDPSAADSAHAVSKHDHVEHVEQTTTLRPPVGFPLLRLMGWSTIRAHLFTVGNSTSGRLAENGDPAVVRILWRPGAVESVLSTGASGIPGSPHALDQFKTWSRGETVSRSLTFPLSKRTCVLVPLRWGE